MDLLNVKDYQLTENMSFQIKRFPAWYDYNNNKILFRISTFAINKMYFESILN